MRLKRIVSVCIVAALGLSRPVVSNATSQDWVGNGVNANWSTLSNWFSLTPPSGGDDARFGDTDLTSSRANSILDTNRTIHDFAIQGPSSNGDFSFTGSNTTLTVTGQFQMVQPFPKKDDATLGSGLTVNAAAFILQNDSRLTLASGATLLANDFEMPTGTAAPSLVVGSGATLSLATAGHSAYLQAGTLQLSAGGAMAMASGTAFSVQNSGTSFNMLENWAVPAGVTLGVSSGGYVQNNNYLDVGTQGASTFTVDGSGSSANIGAVADFYSDWASPGGSATVTFSNSATGYYGNGLHIANAGGTANVNINSGATLNVVNGLTVGGGGTSAAIVTLNSATLAISSGTTAFASFGNGSTFNLQSGTLALAGNATFGTGSTLNWSGGTISVASGNTLAVNGGVANLATGGVVFNGETLSITNGGVLGAVNNLNFGFAFSGSGNLGTLLVSGANSHIASAVGQSIWGYGSGNAATMTFANSGVGTFTGGVAAGIGGGKATVNVNSNAVLNIAQQFFAGATTAGDAATVSIAGGTFNSTGTTSFEANSTLSLSSGGFVLGNDATFSSGSTLNWTGGTINVASGHTLLFDGGTFNRNAVTGQSLVNGATLSVDTGGQIIGSGNLDIANLNGSGTLLADGTNTLVSAGALSDWGRNTGHSATVSLSNSAVANLNSLEIGAVNAASTVTLASGSALNTAGTLLVGGGTTVRTVALNLSGGKLTTTGAATFDNQAVVTQTGGTTTFNGTAAFLSGSTLSLSAGSVNFNNNATFSTGSTFNFSGGSLNVASGKTLEIDGTGTLSNLHTFNTGWTLSVGTAGLVTTPALSIATGGTAATLLVNGTGATLNAIGVSGGSNIANGGTLIVSNGGVANFNTSTFGTPGLSDGLGGGYIQAGPNGGTINVGTLNLSSGSFTTHLTLNGGTVNTTGAASFSGSSQISYSSGSFNVGGALSTANTAAITTSAGTVLRTHGLTMSDTSLINLTGGLIDDYTGGSPLTTITGYVTTGRNGGLGGLWKGVGIDSSAAAADPTHKAIGIGEASAVLSASGGTFAGQTVDGTSVLARYTYLGDANLDGKVDVVDLGLLASHWQQSGNWTGGDFNYDGKIDVVDLGELASNWQAGTTGPSSMSFEQAMAFVGLGNTSVPEPAALGTLLAVALMLRRRAA